MKPKRDGSLQIRDLSDLPGKYQVISHGKQSVFKLPKEVEKDFCVFELSEGVAWLVTTSENVRSRYWYFLVGEIRNRGYTIEAFAIIDRSLLSDIIDSRLDGRKDEDVVDDMFSSIIGDSAGLKWLNARVAEAMEYGASDVHFEVAKRESVVRIRVDGALRVLGTFPSSDTVNALASAYTLVADERSRSAAAFNYSMAQSAVIPLVVDGVSVGLRYQSHPTVKGFDVVFRILKMDEDADAPPDLSLLGYTESQSSLLEIAMSSHHGGIFVAGVTGSGKSTTLSVLLNRVASSNDRKIISIEDPVEKRLTGTTQFSVQREGDDNKGDISFQNAIMAFLRMDPDVGMFGEIRDPVSALMAQSAIETGHKLLTTVHATSALGVVGRLCSPALGLYRDVVCSTHFITCLVYQVLVPKCCEHCKVPSVGAVDSSLLDVFRERFGLDPGRFYSVSESGCQYCLNENFDYGDAKRLGIKGVTVAAEVVLPDVQLLKLLRSNQDLEAYEYYVSLRTTGYDDPDMTGKAAWGHALYLVSEGILDPLSFVDVFGHPSLIK